MIAYTQYKQDGRVRREAETLVAQKNYSVTVLVPKEGDCQKNYKFNGVNIKELNMQQYRGKNKINYIASYMEFLCRAFFVCNKLLFLRQVDIFHIHNMPNFLIFSAILARVCGKKLILDIHDSVPETYATKFDNGSSKILFKILCYEEIVCCWIAHRIICVNHPQRDTLVSRGINPAKIIVSLNVPDHRWCTVKKDIASSSRDSKTFRLVYHGTLAKRLGIDIVMQAVGKLVRKIPEMEFHIYGGGDDMEDFIKLREKLQLQPFVHFHGSFPLDELLPMIASMDLGIVGNRKSIATELMLPVKMLEYVSLDIPVIVPRLRTIKYYFTDEMVSYFEPEDVCSLSASILELYHDRRKRERQTRLARGFLDQFGWEIHQKDFLNLYNSL